jgi:predicted nuclease of predicted toxin-antitoxin system
MKILVDENIPRMTVDSLRSLGHEVRDVRGTAEQGIPDAELWQIVVDESRLLVTTDKGFTEYRTSPHWWILVVRLRQPNRRTIHNSVMRMLERFRDDEWPNLLVVVRDATMSTFRC